MPESWLYDRRSSRRRRRAWRGDCAARGQRILVYPRTGYATATAGRRASKRPTGSRRGARPGSAPEPATLAGSCSRGVGAIGKRSSACPEATGCESLAMHLANNTCHDGQRGARNDGGGRRRNGGVHGREHHVRGKRPAPAGRPKHETAAAPEETVESLAASIVNAGRQAVTS